MTAVLGHSSLKLFILRVVAPLFAAAILANIVAAGLLYWSTSEADEISIERQRALVDLVVSRLQSTVSHDQESVTVWDDAVVRVKAKDQEWIDVNLGSWMATYFGHDASFILSPSNAPIYAFVDGAIEQPERLSELWPHAAPLVESLRTRLRAGDDTGTSDRVLTIGASDLAVVSGRPAIISVKPIVSDSGEIEQVAGEEYLHVAIRRLDDSLVEDLNRNYLLDGLRFDWNGSVGAHEVSSPLQNAAGQALGHYVWMPYRPGQIVWGHVWPILISLFFAGVLVLSVLLVIVRRRSLALKTAQEEMRHLAMHDVLTGLPNRKQFGRRLEAALPKAGVEGTSISLLYLDLDRFKEVNDTLGHQAGDILLREFANRLQLIIGADDTVSRLGGDEFSIVHLSTDAAEDVSDFCGRILDSVRQPIDLSGTPVFVGVSIGVATAPQHAATAAELIRKADIALYAAKANGRSNYAVFSPEMDELRAQRRKMEQDLRAALDNPGEFDIHYQPLIDAKNGRIAGVEALLRWTHPVHGRVPPDVFIPIAETTGLIERLGEIVLKKACGEASAWPIDTLAVNVSAVELKSATYAMRVANTLLALGFNPRRLELEVTETAMSDTDGHCQRNIFDLRALGVRFALDDFGTGFSSLGRLQHLDVDRIKIDRSFINGFGTANGDEAIIRAIVELAQASGLKTTAEGVETDAQDSFLRLIGCDDLQGFLLGRPMPAAELERVWWAGAESNVSR